MITPHTAFYSSHSSREMREMAAQEVRRGLLNKMPGSLRNCVNKHTMQSLPSSSNPLINKFNTANQNNMPNPNNNAVLNNPLLGFQYNLNKTSSDARSNPSPLSTSSNANSAPQPSNTQQQQLLAQLARKSQPKFPFQLFKQLTKISYNSPTKSKWSKEPIS